MKKNEIPIVNDCTKNKNVRRKNEIVGYKIKDSV